MNFLPTTCGLVLLVALALPWQVHAATPGPALLPADLEAAIEALPERLAPPGPTALADRLSHLQSGRTGGTASDREAEALRSALEILAACRAIRLDAELDFAALLGLGQPTLLARR